MNDLINNRLDSTFNKRGKLKTVPLKLCSSFKGVVKLAVIVSRHSGNYNGSGNQHINFEGSQSILCLEILQ